MRPSLPKLGWLVLVLAFTVAGWLAFDGLHGLATGDYVTPSSGARAGQLGPWSKLVAAVGLAPRSRLVMSLHVAIGLAWIGAIVAWLRGARHGHAAMVAGAVSGLWYLPFGTLLGAIQLALLSTPPLRRYARALAEAS